MSQNNQPQPPSSPPVHRIQFGTIQAAIWANEDSPGVVRYKATYSRRYRARTDDQDANAATWQDSFSFGAADCVVLSVLAGQAADWIQSQDAKRSALPTGPSQPRGDY